MLSVNKELINKGSMLAFLIPSLFIFPVFKQNVRTNSHGPINLKNR